MLILSRKINESIVIGSDIEVKITKIEGDVVKIGVVAPQAVSIYRKEILHAVNAVNQASAMPSASNKLQQLKQFIQHRLKSD